MSLLASVAKETAKVIVHKSASKVRGHICASDEIEEIFDEIRATKAVGLHGR